MDPAIYFNQYIFEEILQYIPARELKELATVNKLWYEAIATSSILMRKFYLGIRGDWMEKDDIHQIASASNRNFRKLLMSDVNDIFDDVFEKILLKPNSYWTCVEIFGLTLSTTEDFIKVINTFHKSVKELVLNNIKIIQSGQDFHFQMENLRKLKISFCDIEITKNMIKSAQNVTTLELLHAPEYDENISQYLKEIVTLKKLEMRGEWFTKFFSQQTDVKFQLEEFNIACIDYAMPEEIVTNFYHFLEKQYCLKKINLSEWFGLKVLSCVYKMTTLKELSMFISPFFRWGIESLPKNSSIEELDVRSLDVTDEFFNLVILLSATPNIKSLRLRSINEALAHFMKITLKKLSTISLVHSNVSSEIQKILPDIEFV